MAVGNVLILRILALISLMITALCMNAPGNPGVIEVVDQGATKPKRMTRKRVHPQGATKPNRTRVIGYSPAADQFAAQQALKIYWGEKAVRDAVPDKTSLVEKEQSLMEDDKKTATMEEVQLVEKASVRKTLGGQCCQVACCFDKTQPPASSHYCSDGSGNCKGTEQEKGMTGGEKTEHSYCDLLKGQRKKNNRDFLVCTYEDPLRQAVKALRDLPKLDANLVDEIEQFLGLSSEERAEASNAAISMARDHLVEAEATVEKVAKELSVKAPALSDARNKYEKALLMHRNLLEEHAQAYDPPNLKQHGQPEVQLTKEAQEAQEDEETEKLSLLAQRVENSEEQFKQAGEDMIQEADAFLLEGSL